MPAPAALLLHGFLLNARLWAPTFERLPSQTRVHAPNLRGHGDAPVSRSVTVAEMADDLVRLLDAQRVSWPVTVVGFSLGGYVALELLRAYPDRVGALVLVSTRARADTDEEITARRELELRVAAEGTHVAVDAYAPRLFSPHAAPGLRERWHDEMSETDPLGVIAALDAMATRPDAERVLGTFRGPVHILVGEDDVLTPPAEARRMQQLAPHAQLDIVPGAGHMLPVEAPAAVATAIAALA